MLNQFATLHAKKIIESGMDPIQGAFTHGKGEIALGEYPMEAVIFDSEAPYWIAFPELSEGLAGRQLSADCVG